MAGFLLLAACVGDKDTVPADGSTSAASSGEASSATTSAATPDGSSTTSDGTTSEASTAAETTGTVVGCGNGIVELDEQCDGEDLGGSTCLTLFGYPGQLACTEACTFELLGCIPLNMVLVPGGEFEMGSDAFSDDERPARNVDVDSFYIDINAVTVADYAECMQDGACNIPMPGIDCNWGVAGRDDHPINCVTWYDADAYCGWVGGVITKRLPTEAEWEKAARGDDARVYPWGDAPLPTCTHVVMDEGNGGGCGNYSSLPVGSRPMGNSPYGVQDMAGGIWSWVNDWYAVYDVSETDDPTGPPSGVYKIIRGGGWDTTDIDWFRTSARNPHTPDMQNRNIGFRCAQDLPTWPPP